MALVTFKTSELNELIKNSESGVSLVSKCTRQLLLTFYQLSNLHQYIKDYLYSTIAKYDTKLDAIILSYKKVTIQDMFSIKSDGKTKVWYSADIYTFKPKIGSILSGVVNKKSGDHVGCLVHRVFNIAIPRPSHEDQSLWIGWKLKIGQEIQFKVIDMELNEDMPYIKGELINRPGLEFDVNGNGSESDEEQMVSLTDSHMNLNDSSIGDKSFSKRKYIKTISKKHEVQEASSVSNVFSANKSLSNMDSKNSPGKSKKNKNIEANVLNSVCSRLSIDEKSPESKKSKKERNLESKHKNLSQDGYDVDSWEKDDRNKSFESPSNSSFKKLKSDKSKKQMDVTSNVEMNEDKIDVAKKKKSNKNKESEKRYSENENYLLNEDIDVYDNHRKKVKNKKHSESSTYVEDFECQDFNETKKKKDRGEYNSENKKITAGELLLNNHHKKEKKKKKHSMDVEDFDLPNFFDIHSDNFKSNKNKHLLTDVEDSKNDNSIRKKKQKRTQSELFDKQEKLLNHYHKRKNESFDSNDINQRLTCNNELPIGSTECERDGSQKSKKKHKIYNEVDAVQNKVQKFNVKSNNSSNDLEMTENTDRSYVMDTASSKDNKEFMKQKTKKNKHHGTETYFVKNDIDAVKKNLASEFNTLEKSKSNKYENPSETLIGTERIKAKKHKHKDKSAELTDVNSTREFTNEDKYSAGKKRKRSTTELDDAVHKNKKHKNSGDFHIEEYCNSSDKNNHYNEAGCINSDYGLNSDFSIKQKKKKKEKQDNLEKDLQNSRASSDFSVPSLKSKKKKT